MKFRALNGQVSGYRLLGVYACWWADGGWIRLRGNGPGIAWTREHATFSERMGITKPILVLFGWRYFYLEPAC